MRSSRRSQRQRRRRVDNASAAVATRAHASTEDLPLTSSCPHRTALVVPSALASADRSFSVDDRDRVVRVGENLSLVSTAFPSVQFPAVPDDVDAFTYACAASAVANRTGRADGVTGTMDAPNQWLIMSNPTPLGCPHSDDQHPGAPHDINVSLRYAQLLSERPNSNLLHQCDQTPRLSSAKVAPQPDGTAQLLEDLRKLATWPRLRVATLPDPVVGGHDVDPTGVSDRLGMKGLSVYSAFVDRESYRCHVCGVRSEGMSLALLHQRHRRHFQQ